MQYQRNPNKTIVGFCEDFWSRQTPKLHSATLLLSFPILLLLFLIGLWGSLGGRVRALVVFLGVLLGLLTAFSR